MNSAPISCGSRVELDEASDHSTLRIRDKTRDDAGTYRIKISNKAGSDSATFEVAVKGKRLSAVSNICSTIAGCDCGLGG